MAFNAILISALVLVLLCGVGALVSLWRAFERDEERVQRLREARAQDLAEQEAERQHRKLSSSSATQANPKQLTSGTYIPKVNIPKVNIPKVNIPRGFGDAYAFRQAQEINRIWGRVKYTLPSMVMRQDLMRAYKALANIQITTDNLEHQASQPNYPELIETSTPRDIEKRLHETEQRYGRSA